MSTETDTKSVEKPVTWLEWATTTANGVTATLGAAGAIVAAAVAAYSYLFPPVKTSSICQFPDGWIDYKPLLGMEIGSLCNDMAGGSGQFVLKGFGPRIPVSTICQFPDGWHNYSSFPPTRLGTPCHDGNGKSGHVVQAGLGSEL